MDSATLSSIFITLHILVLIWPIWQSIQMLRQGSQPVTALFYTLSLVSMLLSDFYWIAYVVIRPNTRMPFAVNEIGEWAGFLLLSASLASVFRGRKKGTVHETIMAALFAAASTVLWIAWSGEWMQDIITGIVFSYLFCAIVQALRSSEILSHREWICLGAMCLILIIMQAMTFVLPKTARNAADFSCYVLMFAGIIAFYAKTIREWKRQAPPEALFCLCCASLAWSVSCMYMSAEPMYFVAEATVTIMIPVMTMSLGKVVMQDDLC